MHSAAKKQIRTLSPLVAASLSENGNGFVSSTMLAANSHPALDPQAAPRISPRTFVSSTLRWAYSGCSYETVSARLDQRYYNPWFGRFNTPDPMGARAANPANPTSWNRYAYVGGDPVNYRDSTGLLQEGDVLEWAGDGGSGGGGGGFCIPQPIGETGIYYDCTVSSSGPSDPSSFQGNPARPITISNLSTTSIYAVQVQNQLRWIQQAVKDDDTCNSWLKNNQIDIDFMLGSGAGNTTMRVGVGNFSDSTTNAVAGTAGTNLTPGSMDITVNRDGAFFSSNVTTGYGVNIAPGTFEAQIFILLHELGHVTAAADFRMGDQSEADQRWNNALVLENCGSTVRRAAGGYQ